MKRTSDNPLAIVASFQGVWQTDHLLACLKRAFRSLLARRMPLPSPIPVAGGLQYLLAHHANQWNLECSVQENYEPWPSRLSTSSRWRPQGPLRPVSQLFTIYALIQRKLYQMRGSVPLGALAGVLSSRQKGVRRQYELHMNCTAACRAGTRCGR